MSTRQFEGKSVVQAKVLEGDEYHSLLLSIRAGFHMKSPVVRFGGRFEPAESESLDQGTSRVSDFSVNMCCSALYVARILGSKS